MKVGKQLGYCDPSDRAPPTDREWLADLDERWTDPHRTPVAEGSRADLPAIALNNFLKSKKYWARQRCEGAAGGEFVQQAVARSYLHEARIIGH